MRAVFGAFQRGLERGRRGLPAPHHTHDTPADPDREPPTSHADEGTDADDER
jgi:hypothetical protein